ncbi:MAG: chemotaxis protein CheD [Spirochaetes bacterium]|nr:chemotaxis protein CheD [Spirochaetota bacterium]
MNFDFINVGIADYAIAKAPNILRTVLGSCVGICLYDPQLKIAGLSHIMLPSKNEKGGNDKKYADTAIELMLKEMESMGALRERIVAKIVGGATMFRISSNSLMSEIGKNNVLKVRDVLARLNIKIIAEDTGGNYGRTIDFYSESGILRIRSLGREEKVL